MIAPPHEDRETRSTRRRYDRLSRWYDGMTALSERSASRWRRQLWASVAGPNILEVGVGTGQNMRFYPAGARIVAVDLSPGMLRRAELRARGLRISAELRTGDAQALEFPDASFDDVVATFVFCSVPDPVLGLAECRRVLRPGGRLHLLEHVRAEGRLSGWLMDRLNVAVREVMGGNINRRTVANVHSAGLSIERDDRLALGGIVRMIVASRRERSGHA
jgi:phosphatidylethanolamine/phosphatidyl-N-methylethanolamine N-methyltransferase